jgi:hypothetical protein
MNARGRGRDDGQSTVEFALVLPLLIVLFLGIVQGVALAVEATRVESAAREAARAAAIGRDEGGVRDAAARGGGGLDRAKLEVVIAPYPVVSGHEVVVTVRYRGDLVFPALRDLGARSPELHASVTVLAE